MLIDFKRKLTTLAGVECNENGEPLTVGVVVCNVISVMPTDAAVAPGERKKRFLLSVKVYQAEAPIELDEADIDLVKRLVNASAIPPLYTEQVCLALEGKPNPLARDEPQLKLVGKE